MNIIEILERSSPATYTIEEMQFAVKSYIKQVKNLDVEVNIYKNVPPTNMNPFQIAQLHEEHISLMNAFQTVQLNYKK